MTPLSTRVAGATDLSERELSALRYLESYGSVATHFIAKHVGWRDDTARAYRMLTKLADKKELIERVTTMGTGRTYWWRISLSGRRALSSSQDSPI